MEDPGQAAREGDDRDVLAAAGRDVEGPGPEGLGLGRPAPQNRTAAWMRSQRVRPEPALVMGPRRCVSPELASRGTRPR